MRGDKGIKSRAAKVSVVSNTMLVLIKGFVGLLTGSISILAECIHSAVDLVAAVIAYLAVRVADQPPDEAHTYGHGKYENISGAVEAFLIIVAAAYIGYEAVARILNKTGVERLGAGMGIMILSCIVNFLVSELLFRVAKKADSIALEADAQHLRLDVYTSFGVFLGLLLVYLTGAVIIDRLLGLVVALWIAWIGIQLSRKAVGPLLDLQLPAAEVERIATIIDSEPNVVGFHKLRTRKSGHQRHVDVHLVVPKCMSLTEAHNLAEEIEDKIRAEFDNVFILTHVEPEDE
ncbi:MAG: cation diffusion facilitator family transporter [Armatimonadota bacterium]